jgi:hypothetical protein
MDLSSKSQDMNKLFEAILDSDRLSLISHLSQEELSLSELAAHSNMGQKEVHRHLEVLANANLVNVHDRNGKQVYRFNPKHLEEIKRQQFARSKNETNFDEFGFSKENQKILIDYTHQDGSLKMIPTKSKKIIAVLDYLILSFEKGIEYSEVQVNEILDRYYPDPTTLRRYLIDNGYLGRSKNGSRYWVIDSQDPETRKS